MNKITWNNLNFYNHDGEHLQTLPRHYTEKTQPIDWKNYFDIFIQKPGGAKHSSVYPFLPKQIRRYLETSPSDNYRDNLKLLRDLLYEDFLIDEIAQAIESLAKNAYNESLLRHALYQSTTEPDLATLNDKYTPKCAKNYRPQLEQYNRLMPLEGGEANAVHPGAV